MRKSRPNATIERQIRRSQAAAILGGLTARTMRRKELAGLLTPIKPNARLTLYAESEVLRLAAGNVAEPHAALIQSTVRAGNGQFAAAKP